MRKKKGKGDILNIQLRKVTELNPAVYNPRKKLTPEDKEYQDLKRSIEEHGYLDPIIVNTDGTIIGGHQRYTVLCDLGYEEIEVNVVDIPDKLEEKKLNIALNKVGGIWDEEKLQAIVKEFDELNITSELLGFKQDEIDLLLDVDISSELGGEMMEDEELPPEPEYDDDIEDEDVKEADTVIVIGEYRIPFPRAAYMDWINKVRLDVGFDEESIKKEILRRLDVE